MTHCSCLSGCQRYLFQNNGIVGVVTSLHVALPSLVYPSFSFVSTRVSNTARIGNGIGKPAQRFPSACSHPSCHRYVWVNTTSITCLSSSHIVVSPCSFSLSSVLSSHPLSQHPLAMSSRNVLSQCPLAMSSRVIVSFISSSLSPSHHFCLTIVISHHLPVMSPFSSSM
jgi:hypothetical protein